MINSTANKQVKRVVNLRNRAKARREEGVYVAEGLRMCRELSPMDTEILFVTEGFAGDRENRRWMDGFRFEMVTDVVMKVMADTQTPQGVLAVDLYAWGYTENAPEWKTGSHGTGNHPGSRESWNHRKGRGRRRHYRNRDEP